jgi:hypothetical protein
MSCPAIAIQGKDLVFTVQWHDGTGAACDATGVVSYAIYEDEAATPILTGSMANLAAQTGFYSEALACTIANGFEKFKTYTIRIAATVAGVVVIQVFSFLCLGTEAVAGSESTGLICTLADVKDRLGLNDDFDTVLTRIITSIEGIFDTETRRTLIVTEEDVTEYFTPEGNYIQLDRYPVVGITSIKYATDYDFDNADVLVEDEDYRLMKQGKNGIIYFPSSLASVPDSLQIIGRGGFCSAGQTAGVGEFAMDAGLRELAIQQSDFLFKRKDDIGLSSVSSQGGSISKFSDMELLPLVKNELEKFYRRPSL